MKNNYSFNKNLRVKFNQTIQTLFLMFMVLFFSSKTLAQNFELVTVSSVSSGSSTNNALFVASSPTIPSLAFIRAQRIAGPEDGYFTINGDDIRYTSTSTVSGIPNNLSRIRFTFLQADGTTPIPVNDFRFIINDIDGPNNEALATDCGANLRFSAVADPTNLIIDNVPPDLSATGTQNESSQPTSRVMYEYNDVTFIEFDNYANNGYLKDFDMDNDLAISTPIYAVCLGDIDNDGVTDDLDLDDDNDGILDVIEAGGNDPNGDNDGDGLPNYLDVSDDSGASATYIANADGSVTDYTDADSDGVPDVFEASADADSLPNHLDSDSDNDGCPDTDEVYGAGTDSDNNGYYGSGIPVVDANGLVIAAGVTGSAYDTLPSDNDSNGTDDYLQASIAVTGITTDPSPVSSSPINNVTFDVVPTTSGIGTAVQYQWQEQIDGIGSWNDLVDGGNYSGTTIQTLTVTVLNAGLDGNLYRAVISSPTYVCDTDATSSGALLTVTISNSAPVATDDDFVTNEDVTLNGNNIITGANGNGIDSDPDTDPLEVSQFVIDGTPYIITSGSSVTANILGVGDVTIASDGSLTFVPEANYNGSVPTITYTLTDGALTDEAAVNITITSVNDTPLATDDTPVDVLEDSGLTNISVLGNDSFGGDGPNVGSITVTAIAASVGTAVLNDGGTANDSTDDTIDFTPAANYNGAVSIDYIITDSDGDTSTATATFNVTSVNDTPLAADDTPADVLEDSGLTNISVLGNDSFGGDGPNVGSITVTAIAASVGTAVLKDGGTANNPADDTIDFTPAANYNGAVSIDYTITDSDGDTSTATVMFNVTSVNDTPLAADDMPADVLEDSGLTNIAVLGNDSFGGDGPNVGSITVTPILASVGTAVLNDGGTANNPADDTIDFTPAANYNGAVSIDYTITDSDGDTSTATVTFNVTAVNDAPVAENNAYSGNEDSTITNNIITDNDVVDGLDNDIDSALLEVTQFIIGGTTYAIVSGSDNTATIIGIGDVTIASDGSLTFVPVLNYNGPVPTITYTLTDGVLTDNADVIITIISVNDPPVADNNSTSTTEDIPVTFNITSTDTDIDGTINSATVDLDPSTSAIDTSVTTVGEGTWTVDINGDVTFTPVLGYVGTSILTYTVNDNDGAISNVANLSVTINDEGNPVANNDSTNTVVNTPVITGNVLANDLVVDDATITSFDALSVNGGTVVNNLDGTFTYTPAVDFVGSDTFTYTLCDDDLPAPSCSTATVTITIPDASELAVSKLASAGPYNVGENVTFTITVTNNGPSDATGIDVLDQLPSGYTFVSATTLNGTYDDATGLWALGSLTDTSVATLTIVATINSTGNYTNIAEVTSADQPDPNGVPHGNNTPGEVDQDEVTITPVAQADIVTIKTDGSATYTAGTDVVYTISVTNNGPSDAVNVLVSDTLPVGTTGLWSGNNGSSGTGDVSDTIPLLTNGSTVTYTVTVSVPSDFTGNLVNTVVVTTPTPDPDSTCVGCTDTDTEAPSADIVTVKTDGNTTYTPGTDVVYTISVTNNGPSDAVNVLVTDILPIGTTGLWSGNGSVNIVGDLSDTIGSLTSGSTVIYTVTVSVPSDFTGDLVNTASAVSPTPDPDPSCADCTDTNTENSLAELAVSKLASAGPYNVGENVTFTITVTNNGPSDTTGIDVLDQLPSGYTFVSATTLNGTYDDATGLWALGSLTDTSVATLTIVATINSTGNYTNIAEVTSADQPDPNGVPHGNNTPGEVDQDEVTITPIPITDLEISKSVDNAIPNEGDIVTYTLTVINNGPSIATGVQITDNLPVGLAYVSHLATGGDVNTYLGGVWDIGTIANGSSATLTIDALVTTPGTTAQIPIVNTITNVAVNETDPTPDIDDSTAEIVVTASDLVTVKTVSDPTPNEGDTITYTILVTNNGPSDATGVSLVDNLPIGVTYVSHSTAEGVFNNGSGEWTIGALANGATATLTIDATVNLGTVGQTITNTTRDVIADQSDPNPDNNSGSVDIVPTAFIDLSLTKTVMDDVVDPEVGDIITFEVRVDNEGPTEATGVQVTDIIPSGYDFINYSSSIGTYNPITGLWNISFIEIGNTAVLLVDVIVMDTGEYVNCAEITATNEIDVDSTPNNGVDNGEDDYGCASAPPIQEVDLRIEKTVIADNLTPLVDTEVTFEIRLINDGGIEATEVIVTDLLPTGYTFLNYSSTRGTYDDDSGIWNVGTIVDGETETLLIDAIVNATGDYLNCATITAMHQTDPDLSNNTSCIATEPIAVADLELTKGVDVYEPYAETNVDFTINLTNNGPSDATGVQVKDLLPTGYAFVSYSSTTGTYDDNSGLWNVGSVINGDTETLIITAYVLPIGEWTNVAEVVAANELDLDSTPDNNDIYEDDQDEQKTEPIVLLTVPEGFSPDGDGINDTFEIEFLEILYPNFSMEIVNRYGNKVYEYKHNGNPNTIPMWWGGFSDGRWNLDNLELPVGTYFYTIYFNNDERRPQTGWIYLRR